MSDPDVTRRRAIRTAIIGQAIREGALASVDLGDTVHIDKWTNINLNALTVAIDSAIDSVEISQRSQSAPVPRAEPAVGSREGEPLRSSDGSIVGYLGLDDSTPVGNLHSRVAELERWRSTLKSEMVTGPATVTCKVCSGTGRPTPEAFAYHKANVCEGCGGSGVHRV